MLVNFQEQWVSESSLCLYLLWYIVFFRVRQEVEEVKQKGQEEEDVSAFVFGYPVCACTLYNLYYVSSKKTWHIC